MRKLFTQIRIQKMTNGLVGAPIGWNERVTIANAITGLRQAIKAAEACLGVLEEHKEYIEQCIVENCEKDQPNKHSDADYCNRAITAATGIPTQNREKK